MALFRRRWGSTRSNGKARGVHVLARLWSRVLAAWPEMGPRAATPGATAEARGLSGGVDLRFVGSVMAVMSKAGPCNHNSTRRRARIAAPKFADVPR